MAWYDCNFNIYLGAGELGKATKKKLASFKNQISFVNTFNVKVQDALHRYHFEGLPDTISERVILQALLWYASVVFFEREGNLLALPCAPSGDGFNIYGDYGSVWAFSRNGMLNEEIKVYLPGSDESSFLGQTLGGIYDQTNKGVLVWENTQRFPFINQTIFYSSAISDSMRTLDVCRKNIKNPYIVVAEESAVNTVKQYFESRDNNEEYIISSGVFPADKVKVLPLVTNSDNLQAITALIEWYEAKYRELCGVDNNSQIDKKGENLIQAELSVNDEYTDMSVDKCIETIQKGLDDVNKIFGTNITVKANRSEKLSTVDNLQEGEDKDERKVKNL